VGRIGLIDEDDAGEVPEVGSREPSLSAQRLPVGEREEGAGRREVMRDERRKMRDDCVVCECSEVRRRTEVREKNGEEKRKVESGEWRVESGEWRVERKKVI